MSFFENNGWPVPAVNPENEAFFIAAEQERLLYGRCDHCQKAHYYPRRFCPHCFSCEVTWANSCGRGHIYSYTFTGEGAHLRVVAYVELEEGFLMPTNIVPATAQDLAIGAAVRAIFVQAGQYKLPVFTLEKQKETV